MEELPPEEPDLTAEPRVAGLAHGRGLRAGMGECPSEHTRPRLPIVSPEKDLPRIQATLGDVTDAGNGPAYNYVGSGVGGRPRHQGMAPAHRPPRRGESGCGPSRWRRPCWPVPSWPYQIPRPGQTQVPQSAGGFGIGRCVLDWTDRTRTETLSGKPGAHREVLVYLFYPTDRDAPGPRAEYFPAPEGGGGLRGAVRQELLPRLVRDQLRDHRRPAVPLRGGRPAGGWRGAVPRGGLLPWRRLPVLYYPAIIEHLVRHGYVVAAVEHPFDGGTIVFPDGRIVTPGGWDEDPGRTPQEQAAFHASRHRAGAQDNCFALDQLGRANASGLSGVPAGLRGRLDVGRAGALGHSFGGMAPVMTGHADPRFRVCLNLDGALDAGLTYGELSRPVFAVYGDNRRRKPNEGAEAFAKRRAARDRFIERLKSAYAGAPDGSSFILVDSPAFSRFSYYDFPSAQAEQPPWRATAEQWARNQRIIQGCTLAVMDAGLRSEQSRPLAALPDQIPEVKLEPIGGPRGRH